MKDETNASQERMEKNMKAGQDQVKTTQVGTYGKRTGRNLGRDNQCAGTAKKLKLM